MNIPGPLFYHPEAQLGVLEFPREDAFHGAQVLRMKAGEGLYLTNGKGFLYHAVIEEISSKKMVTEVVELLRQEPESRSPVHIAVAPTKNIERYEWFVEKAVEIGVSSITPLLCDHSERKVVKYDRTERIIIAAMKQSERLWLPVLNEMTRFSSCLDRCAAQAKYIASCSVDPIPFLFDLYKPEQSVCVLIGPEGDFSPEEISLAVQKGFEKVSLGNSRLRTETAALVALNTLNLLNQRND